MTARGQKKRLPPRTNKGGGHAAARSSGGKTSGRSSLRVTRGRPLSSIVATSTCTARLGGQRFQSQMACAVMGVSGNRSVMKRAKAAGPPARLIARSSGSCSEVCIPEVKHCLYLGVKHCLIPLRTPYTQNQVMLDAHELARRLREAMDNRVPKLSAASLAKSCKVTDQAVNGWRKTGRIAKKHLQKIAAETGKPIGYFLGEDTDTVTVNYGLTLKLEEAEAMKRLQKADPDWRRYVLSLAMVDRAQQDLLLHTMRQAVPDYQVEKAFGPAPHVKAKQK